MRFDPAHDAGNAAQSDNANAGLSHAGFRSVQLRLHRHATCPHFECPTSDATSRNRVLFTGIARQGGDHLATTQSRGRPLFAAPQQSLAAAQLHYPRRGKFALPLNDLTPKSHNSLSSPSDLDVGQQARGKAQGSPAATKRPEVWLRQRCDGSCFPGSAAAR